MTDSRGSTAVLIVGGGLVGLSAGLFLQHLGVPFVLVEKNDGLSPLPRARGIHLRTMELFRQVGVEEAVKDAAAHAWVQGGFGGGRRGRTLVDAEPVGDASTLAKAEPHDPSPSNFGACPQTLIEPILRRHLEKRGGDVRFGHELLAFDDTGDAVVARVRGPDGDETTIAATWMIAADGGRGSTRRALGIGTVDTPAPQHLVNVFFHADLTEVVRGRTFSQCEIANERVRGLFLSMNNADRWSFHLEYDPAQGPPPDDALPDLVRAAIGLPTIPVDIRSHGTWSTGVRIAERYRGGGVFLCGDAAHLMPPWGGFNATTGIADAHNLAWKLAAVVRGDATVDLLETYDAERRPVAIRNGEQALLRADLDARFGVETAANRAIFPRLVDSGALLLRHRYPTADHPKHASVDALRAQVGTRFPHAWIVRDGRRQSTLDLFGASYVLLAGPKAAIRAEAPTPALSPTGARVFATGRDFAFDDGDWIALTGLPDDGRVLVRPDGFVASRSDGV